MKSICFPATALCLLHWELESAGLSPRSAACDMMSPPTGKERSSNFKN